MKALTICQPYAHAIIHGVQTERFGFLYKRVENRDWAAQSHRGPLLIHAGASRHWLQTWEHELPEKMTYAAILGVVDLVACVGLRSILNGRWKTMDLGLDLSWVKEHPFTEGPICWVFGENPRAFAKPIPYRGMPGLFDVPDEMVSRALKKAGQ